MRVILAMALSLLLVTILPSPASAQSAVHCVSTAPNGSGTGLVMRNNCNQFLAVSWCFVGGRVDGRECRGSGRFYRMSGHLAPGASKQVFREGRYSIRVAACVFHQTVASEVQDVGGGRFRCRTPGNQQSRM